MSEQSLQITFSADAETETSARTWINLEQVGDAGQDETVSMYDIQQMVAIAKSGKSALTYKAPNCPAYIDGVSVVVDFGVFVWPSDMTMPYTMISSIGSVSDPVIIEREVEFSVTFEQTDVIEFDYVMDELISVEWETECYDTRGNVIEVDPPVLDGNTTIRIDRPCFGVCRIKGVKVGTQHNISLRLLKFVPAPGDGAYPAEEDWAATGADAFMSYQEWLDRYFPGTVAPDERKINYTGFTIDNLQVTVTAKWVVGATGNEEILKLSVPKCVQDLLSACWNDANGNGIIDPGELGGLGDALGQTFFCRREDDPVNVYVSSCTGEVLKALSVGQDDHSWCGRGGSS